MVSVVPSPLVVVAAPDNVIAPGARFVPVAKASYSRRRLYWTPTDVRDRTVGRSDLVAVPLTSTLHTERFTRLSCRCPVTVVTGPSPLRCSPSITELLPSRD